MLSNPTDVQTGETATALFLLQSHHHHHFFMQMTQTLTTLVPTQWTVHPPHHKSHAPKTHIPSPASAHRTLPQFPQDALADQAQNICSENILSGMWFK